MSAAPILCRSSAALTDPASPMAACEIGSKRPGRRPSIPRISRLAAQNFDPWVLFSSRFSIVALVGDDLFDPPPSVDDPSSRRSVRIGTCAVALSGPAPPRSLSTKASNPISAGIRFSRSMMNWRCSSEGPPVYKHRPQPAAPAVAGPSTMPSQRTGADRRRLLRACPSPDFRHKLLLDGHPSETDLSRCDDDKVSSQATRMLGGEVYDIAADLTTGLRRVPEQDNAQARLSLCEHELTEVFILGQQDPTVTRGKISNFGVRCLCVCISHGDDIVSRAPQGADYGIVAAFVCQEAHLLTGMLNE